MYIISRYYLGIIFNVAFHKVKNNILLDFSLIKIAKSQ